MTRAVPLPPLASHALQELNSSGGLNRYEIYAGSKHLATYANSTTYFIHSDWLGTERARSTVSGSLCETTVGLPYGDGQSLSGSCGDPNPLHFTGEAAASLPVGSALEFKGDVYTLGSDGKWRDGDGDVLYQDSGKVYSTKSQA